ILFPFISVGLMIGAHTLAVKFREQPLDTQNTSIQLGIIGGGAVSVVLAFLVYREIPLTALAYAAGGMALVALGTIALDQARVASKRRAAEKALINAEEAHRLAEEGDTKTAEE